jgi:Protein of unknown function (DUF3667)
MPFIQQSAVNQLPHAEPARTRMSTESLPICRNCGAAVSHSYCSVCGQRFERHLYTVWDVLAEMAEAVTHLDSRLWRTLRALLFLPGELTTQFLAGRRTAYLSPLRLYLGISFVFFIIASLPAPHATASMPSVETAAAAAARCEDSASRVPGPDWIRQRFLIACQSSLADQGRQLHHDFIQNLGRAMFLFLPLVAAFMKLLYWRPTQTYTTHLLLLIHDHACAFLLMSIVLIALRWPRLGGWVTWSARLLACYLMFYLYRSMRQVYGQSRTRTLLKFTALSLAYVFFAACSVFLAGLYSAVTV